MVDRRGDQDAVAAQLKAGAQIVFTQVIGGDIASELRRLMRVVDARPTRKAANQRHQKQESADVG